MTDTTTDVRIESNDQRRAVRLRREINKQHQWRVKTWATAQRYIAERQTELRELGFDEEELFEPDFSTEANVELYINSPS